MKIKDTFGHALWRHFNGEKNVELAFRRDDGLLEIRNLGKYFDTYKKFPEIQKKALKHAHGKVLDIGCGAGKHAIYLQEKGFDVTGLDHSVKCLKICRLRGLMKTKKMDLFKLDIRKGRYDTILLFGSGLAFGRDPKGLVTFLGKLYEITSKGGTILFDSADTKKTKRGLYHWNGKKQFKLRADYMGQKSDWFQPFIASPKQVRDVVKDTKWKIEAIYKNEVGDRFSGVLVKK